MSQLSRPAARLRTLLVSALALGTLAVAPAASQATVHTLNGGDSTWGFHAPVRATFPIYDPLNPGTYNPSTGEAFRIIDEGTVQNPLTTTPADDTFEFPVDSGSFDDVTGAATIDHVGKVRFGYVTAGYFEDSNPVHGIFTSFRNLQVTINSGGTTGSISGDTYAGFHGNAPVLDAWRTFADLDLSTATRTVTGSGVTWSNVKVTLNAVGAPLGLGVYGNGTVLDPITISATF